MMVNYNKFNLQWPILICIVGESGSGKTTIAQLMEKYGIPTIHSYTTRPMREGEKDGVEHIFIDAEEMPDKEEMLAYTKFGGYEYFALKSQVKKPLCTYVIDEDGLINLNNEHGKDYMIYSMYVERKDNKVDEERKERDKGRTVIPPEKYSYIFHNDLSLEELEEKISKLCEELLKEEWYVK